MPGLCGAGGLSSEEGIGSALMIGLASSEAGRFSCLRRMARSRLRTKPSMARNTPGAPCWKYPNH